MGTSGTHSTTIVLTIAERGSTAATFAALIAERGSIGALAATAEGVEADAAGEVTFIRTLGCSG